jgi:hypothetical protein
MSGYFWGLPARTDATLRRCVDWLPVDVLAPAVNASCLKMGLPETKIGALRQNGVKT